jgi:hypothetical protein
MTVDNGLALLCVSSVRRVEVSILIFRTICAILKKSVCETKTYNKHPMVFIFKKCLNITDIMTNLRDLPQVIVPFMLIGPPQTCHSIIGPCAFQSSTVIQKKSRHNEHTTTPTNYRLNDPQSTCLQRAIALLGLADPSKPRRLSGPPPNPPLAALLSPRETRPRRFRHWKRKGAMHNVL